MSLSALPMEKGKGKNNGWIKELLKQRNEKNYGRRNELRSGN